MITWQNCTSGLRTGRQTSSIDTRTDYQRDYDRLIFSSAFRRLQNKTQVFPLPGNAFVHNRLTHSLEVASVGRSLGKIVGDHIGQSEFTDQTSESALFYKYELPGVVAAACLAHDVGNPPFGHSGEKAISAYFIKNEQNHIGTATLRSFFNEEEWCDFTNFEGNANALRVLTHQYTGKIQGGISLTHTTLASILKYPCSSSKIDKKLKHTKKYGYFQSEKAVFEEITSSTNMILEAEGVFKRHPFVYLVEAADDICYRVIDMEDAHRINILSTNEIETIFIKIIEELDPIGIDQVKKLAHTIHDDNEKVAYLRAKLIGVLVQNACYIFLANKDQILQGTWNYTLLEEVDKLAPTMNTAIKLSIDKIYNHHSVIEVELAGYEVMSSLLGLFVPAMLNPIRSSMEEKILQLIPNQFKSKEDSTPYVKIMNIVDFIAGMTDGYATELYRKSKGIEIARHK